MTVANAESAQQNARGRFGLIPPAPPDDDADAQAQRERVDERLRTLDGAYSRLIKAAAPLLRPLADLSPTMRLDQAQEQRDRIVRDVRDFKLVCERADIPPEHALSASYCLCAALDEAAYETEWGAQHGWPGGSLLVELHGDNLGGEKVFSLLARFSHAPAEHIDLLELIYHVLSLGFMGRYAHEPNGPLEMDKLRHRLYRKIAEVRGPPPALFSQYRYVAPPKSWAERLPRWLGLAFSGGMVVVVLLAYAANRFWWWRETRPLVRHMETLTQRVDAHLQTHRAEDARALAIERALIARPDAISSP